VGEHSSKHRIARRRNWAAGKQRFGVSFDEFNFQVSDGRAADLLQQVGGRFEADDWAGPAAGID